MNKAQRRAAKRVARKARESRWAALLRTAEQKARDEGERKGAERQRDVYTRKFSAFTRRDGACDEPLVLGSVPERPYVEIAIHDRPLFAPLSLEEATGLGMRTVDVVRFEARKKVYQFGTGQRVVWYDWELRG